LNAPISNITLFRYFEKENDQAYFHNGGGWARCLMGTKAKPEQITVLGKAFC
jgi:hypothetical protein